MIKYQDHTIGWPRYWYHTVRWPRYRYLGMQVLVPGSPAGSGIGITSPRYRYLVIRRNLETKGLRTGTTSLRYWCTWKTEGLSTGSMCKRYRYPVLEVPVPLPKFWKLTHKFSKPSGLKPSYLRDVIGSKTSVNWWGLELRKVIQLICNRLCHG